jgi:zinc transporter
MNTKDMFLQNTEGGTIVALCLLIASSAISYWALRRMRAF